MTAQWESCDSERMLAGIRDASIFALWGPLLLIDMRNAPLPLARDLLEHQGTHPDIMRAVAHQPSFPGRLQQLARALRDSMREPHSTRRALTVVALDVSGRHKPRALARLLESIVEADPRLVYGGMDALGDGLWEGSCKGCMLCRGWGPSMEVRELMLDVHNQWMQACREVGP